MTKPTLYAVLTRQSRLNIANGDSINELRTLRTLSCYFDVFYNNDAFTDDKVVIGQDRIGPDKDYDFYYIRNNPALFRSIRGRKISFAYPYDEYVFKNSAALLVLTENWKDHLLDRKNDSKQKLGYIYDGEAPVIKVPVINVGQAFDPALVGVTPSESDIFSMKTLTTFGSVFGYYGNLNRQLYPYQAFAALQRLYKDRSDVNPIIALAGRFRKNSEISYRNSVYLGSLPYDVMPSLHANTLANLTNESPLNHCLGNQKVIDSLSRGVPVMCQRLDTFVHQLGEDYPCFYEAEHDAYHIAERLLDDIDFLERVRALSKGRAAYFSPDAVAERFLSQPELRVLTS